MVFFCFSNGFLQFPALSPPAPKGQGLGFTMARKQKAWHSWIHIGKRIAWNNLWSGALDSCVYRTNHWGVASCRGPPAPKGPGPGFHSGLETKNLEFLDSYWKTYSQEQSLVRRLDSCVYRTNHWGVASCRGPPAPEGQGLGFTVARKQKAWHS